jgi:hypothetical protein
MTMSVSDILSDNLVKTIVGNDSVLDGQSALCGCSPSFQPCFGVSAFLFKSGGCVSREWSWTLESIELQKKKWATKGTTQFLHLEAPTAFDSSTKHKINAMEPGYSPDLQSQHPFAVINGMRTGQPWPFSLFIPLSHPRQQKTYQPSSSPNQVHSNSVHSLLLQHLPASS